MKSRAKVRPRVVEVSNGNGNHPNEHTSEAEFVETARGYQVEIIGVSPTYLEDINNAMAQDPEWPAPSSKHPTYTVELAGGGTQTFKHDKDSILAEIVTGAERIAWQDFLRYADDWGTELARRIMNACLIDGLRVDPEDLKTASDPRWIARKLRAGIKVPTGDSIEEQLDREILFIRTEIVGNEDDLQDLTSRVMARAGLDREALQNARSMFQGSVEPQRENPDTPGESIDTEGEVGTLGVVSSSISVPEVVSEAV